MVGFLMIFIIANFPLNKDVWIYWSDDCSLHCAYSIFTAAAAVAAAGKLIMAFLVCLRFSLSLPLTSCQLCVPHGDALYQEIQSIIYRDTPISRHVIN